MDGHSHRDDEARAEAILTRAMEQLRGRLPFEADQALVETIETEARPAVESLDMALSLDTADDIRSLGHHESLAMFSLLGRRLARIGASVLLAHRIAPTLLDAFASEGELSASVRDGLELACLEGFVLGREEQVADDAAQRAARAMPSGRVADGVHLLVLAGLHESEVLTERIEEFGRELHRGDAQSCVIEVSTLAEPSPRRASAVLAAEETARMLGAPCFFGGVSHAWREAFEEAGVDPEHGAIHATLESALAAAYRSAGLSLTRPGPIGRLLRRRASDR
ncbi:MAG: hypothetical protein JJ863_19705 [Deltaproteobacteria bacterium]|nr:hypothetical protein [Deltaproteobacteria bacterium]